MDFMGSFVFLWILMCLCGCVWVLMRYYGSFCVLIGRYASLWVLGVFNASLIVFFVRIGSYASLQVPMGLVRSLLACLHVHFWEPVLSSNTRILLSHSQKRFAESHTNLFCV